MKNVAVLCGDADDFHAYMVDHVRRKVHWLSDVCGETKTLHYRAVTCREDYRGQTWQEVRFAEHWDSVDFVKNAVEIAIINMMA